MDENMEPIEEMPEAEEEAPAPAPVAPVAKRKPAARKGKKRARPASTRPKLPGQRTQSKETMPEVEDEDDELSGLVALVRRAKEVGRSKERAKALLGELTSLMGELDDETFQTIANNGQLQDVFQRVSKVSGTKPGDKIYDPNGREIGYVPFSYADYCEMYPMETWVPRRTDRIEVNGVAIQVYEGFKVTAPKVFYDVQEEAIRETQAAYRMQAGIHAEAGMGRADGTSVEVGWYKETPEELVQLYGKDNGR